MRIGRQPVGQQLQELARAGPGPAAAASGAAGRASSARGSRRTPRRSPRRRTAAGPARRPRSASVRSARTSIMLARSTACRHGLGRTSANAVSMTQQRAVADQQVRRLDVAVGQADLPHPADDGSPWSMTPSSISASPISLGAVEELGDQQVLPLRGDLDDPERLRRPAAPRRTSGAARSPRTGPAGARCGTAARPPAGRTAACGRACTSGRSARAWPRRACRTRRCPDRP